jgi:hypothetical protein
LPFLPAPTVSSAEARPEGPTLTARGFVAPRSRSWSSPRFGSRSASRPSDIFPSGEDPSKLSPLRQPSSASPHSPSSRRGSAFTARAFPLAVIASHAAVLPRLRAPDSTSGLSSAEESVASARCCHLAVLDAPMGFGSNTFRACRGSLLLAGAEPRFAGRCPGPRPASPHPRAGEKAKILGFVWLRRGRCLHPTRRSARAGPARWQPEDCYASGPPAASAPLAGRSDGIGRRRRPDPRTNPRRAATRRIVSRRTDGHR